MARDLPAALAALTRGVTEVRVIAGGVARGKALGDRVLARLTAADATRLLAHLTILQPPTPTRCMCLGDPALELWVGRRRRATLGLHHGLSLRLDGWWADAPLRDGEALLRLLADHGVAAPLAEWLAARAARAAAEAARRAWLAATPEPLRHRLAALERICMHPVRDDGERDVADALAALDAAPAALLAWFGAGAGPWSGYPAYELVAQTLLERCDVAALVAAGDASDDEAAQLGLARFLARHGAAPRERGHLDAALHERLRALVERRCDADARARFAALLPTAPACDGLRIGDAAYAPGLAHAVACGDRWAAIDGDRVVRFDPDDPRGVVLMQLPPGPAELGATPDGGDLLVTLHDVGEVWRVPQGGGPARAIARDQEHPCAPTVIDGRAAWLEQPRRSGHRTATRLRLEGRAAPLASHTGNAWDLLVCDGALLWARHGGSLWSTVFGPRIHRVDLMRCDPRTGRSEVLAELPGSATDLPRIASDGRTVAWTAGDRIGTLDPRTGARRWFAAGGEVNGVLPHGPAIVAAIVHNRQGALVRLDPAGDRRTLARWRRAPWEREQLAVRGARVAWTAGEHLWAIDLPPPTPEAAMSDP